MTSTLDEVLRAAVREVVREELHAAMATNALPPASTPTTTATATPPGEFLSTTQAGAIAGVRPATVRAWIQQGHLREHRAGRLVRVKLDELRAFLARATTGRAEVIDLDSRARDILARPRGRSTRRAR
jgi:excisionase family DNA binding protein